MPTPPNPPDRDRELTDEEAQMILFLREKSASSCVEVRLMTAEEAESEAAKRIDLDENGNIITK